jgi:hypothetical protein
VKQQRLVLYREVEAAAAEASRKPERISLEPESETDSHSTPRSRTRAVFYHRRRHEKVAGARS